MPKLPLQPQPAAQPAPQAKAPAKQAPTVLEAKCIAQPKVDKFTIEAGKEFALTWTFKNIGQCNWPAAVRFLRVQGDDEIVAAPWTSKGPAVAPGEQLEVTLALKAPKEPGQYLTFFRLANQDGIEFGEKVWLDATVVAPKVVEQIQIKPMENQILIDGSDNVDPMLKSQKMLEKFDASPQNRSIEIDARSAESNDFEIQADVDKDEMELPEVRAPEPVIKSEIPQEQLQTAPKPTDENVLLQEKCKALLDALNDEQVDGQPAEGSALVEEVIDKEDQANLKVSALGPAEMQKIAYLTAMDQEEYNQQYKQNLVNLMNMGFFDFKKNLQLLQKHFNNLELVCSKILE